MKEQIYKICTQLNDGQIAVTEARDQLLLLFQNANNEDINYRIAMETIYFQPKGIIPQYCEAGIIHQSDPEHIWYLDEPCKILISEVKIIPKENVTYDKKSRMYLVHQSRL